VCSSFLYLYVRDRTEPAARNWQRIVIYDTPSMPQLSDHPALKPPLVSQSFWGIT